MGTNYYLQWPDKQCEACGHVNIAGEQLHIGKSSVGWHFGFETTKYKTVEEWTAAIDAALKEGAWIMKEGYQLEDYHVPPTEFWELVNNKRNSPECMMRYGHSSLGGTVECRGGIDLCNYSFS